MSKIIYLIISTFFLISCAITLKAENTREEKYYKTAGILFWGGILLYAFTGIGFITNICRALSCSLIGMFAYEKYNGKYKLIFIISILIDIMHRIIAIDILLRGNWSGALMCTCVAYAVAIVTGIVAKAFKDEIPV